MSGKDEFLFSKDALLRTHAGKDIIKQRMLQSKGYKQFNHYKEKTEQEFPSFVQRFTLSLHKAVTSDSNPSSTIHKFTEEVNSQELDLSHSSVPDIKMRLSNPDILADRVRRILDSNFVKMTFPVFSALYDGASKYFGDSVSEEKRKAVIDGHIIAIDLSEPMDRIVDKDEDLGYLDDYKFMNPYILAIARRNMALNRRPLSDIFHLGMAKAGECVGCGNEIEDAIRNNEVKIPSWPLYFAVNMGNVQRGFELTMAKSDLYLDEAKIALDMLPENFQVKPFLEFLFLTVRHYNQYWYNELVRRAPFGEFYKKIEDAVARR